MSTLRTTRNAMRKVRYALESLAFLAAMGSALADEGDLRRCRAIPDTAARLACYDALPLATQAPAPGAAGSAKGGGQPGAATPGRPAPPPEAQFGLAPKPSEEVASIQSNIPGLFEGWRPNQRIRLANGQVWQIADESTSFIQRRDPKVTVRRGALGAFYLDIEGDNRSPRVRRVE